MAKRRFLVKFYKTTKSDPFGMVPPTGDCYIFYCETLNDLYKTIRVLMAKGYRVKKAATLGRRIKRWGGGFLSKNIFGNTTYEVREITKPVTVTQTVNYVNSWQFTHDLKLTEADFEQAN